jgi:hypothetical protein
MVKIKANKDCSYCGGTGKAVPFIGYKPEVLCKCIEDQVEIVPNL